MPQGLQVWDESGDVLLDTSSNTTTLLGKVVAYIPDQTQVFSIPPDATGDIFYIVTPSNYEFMGMIEITKNTNSVTIKTKPIPSALSSHISRWAFTVYIGVY